MRLFLYIFDDFIKIIRFRKCLFGARNSIKERFIFYYLKYEVIMSSKNELKILIMKEALTVQKLAQMLTEKTGKHYTQRSLQNKIFLSSLNFDEMEIIADMLGYEIKIVKKSNVL